MSYSAHHSKWYRNTIVGGGRKREVDLLNYAMLHHYKIDNLSRKLHRDCYFTNYGDLRFQANRVINKRRSHLVGESVIVMDCFQGPSLGLSELEQSP